MKTKVFFIISLLVAFSPLLVAQPKFTLVEGTHFDFGDLYYGTAKKILTIRNDGLDTLEISNVSASCGCTGTLMSNDHLAPHDSGALSITFNTKNIVGKAEKAVSLETNDPDHKKVRITFSANVIGILDLQPEYIYFQLKGDSAGTQNVTVKNRGTSDVNITSATTTMPNVKLSLSRTHLKPTEEATLTVTLSPAGKGTVKGNIELTTDHPKLPSIQVRVFGLVMEKEKSSKR